jgi:hypothetical protein
MPPFDSWLDAMPVNAEPEITVKVFLGGYVGNLIEIAIEQKTSVRAVLSFITEQLRRDTADMVRNFQNKGEPIEGLFGRKEGCAWPANDAALRRARIPRLSQVAAPFPSRWLHRLEPGELSFPAADFPAATSECFSFRFFIGL